MTTETTVTIANAAQVLTNLESDYTNAKAKIVSVVQAHVTAHEQAVAAHQAEVDAAQALLAKADPSATPTADNAAAIVLSSSTQVQQVIIWLSNNWRWAVLGVSIALVLYGWHADLIKL